jgi:hypothetical protein
MLSLNSSQCEKYAPPTSALGTILAEKDASSPSYPRICAVYSTRLLASLLLHLRATEATYVCHPHSHSAGDLVVRSSTTQRGSYTLHRDAFA